MRRVVVLLFCVVTITRAAILDNRKPKPIYYGQQTSGQPPNKQNKVDQGQAFSSEFTTIGKASYGYSVISKNSPTLNHATPIYEPSQEKLNINDIQKVVELYKFQQALKSQPRYRREIQPILFHVNHPHHVPLITKTGVPLDTPEVQLARARHMIAHHQARNRQQHDHHIQPLQPFNFKSPHSPPDEHVPYVGPNGVPIDTPEVQMARAKHFKAHAEAKARHGKKYTSTPIITELHLARLEEARKDEEIRREEEARRAEHRKIEEEIRRHEEAIHEQEIRRHEEAIHEEERRRIEEGGRIEEEEGRRIEEEEGRRIEEEEGRRIEEERRIEEGRRLEGEGRHEEIRYVNGGGVTEFAFEVEHPEHYEHQVIQHPQYVEGHQVHHVHHYGGGEEGGEQQIEAEVQQQHYY